MEEIWKDVVGYEGLYQVSNYGRVKALQRTGTDGRTLKERMLPQRIRSGYWAVSLTKNGIYKAESVHRLVALAFIPNPDNLPQVGHKDEGNFKTSNECNNNVENLYWTTAKENSNTEKHVERISESRMGMEFSNEHRENIGKAQRGKKRGACPQETKDKISKALTGKAASDEAKKKMSQAHKGKLPSNCKKIYCDGIVYPSQAAFYKKFSINKDLITAWLTGRKEMPKEWSERGLRYAD